MSNYSVAEIRELGQPASVMNRRVAEHWTGPAYLRKFSPYVSYIFLKLNFSPTSVTWLMVLLGWLASWILTNPALWAVFLVFVLAQVQMLLDCSDGEVARVTKKFNPAGIYVDRIAHYTTESFFAVAFGIRLYQNGDLRDVIWGLLLALLIVFNKLLNDLVHVTRALSGLEKLSENPEVAVPNNILLKSVKVLFKLLPIHKLFHSIELAFIFLISGLIQYFFIENFERFTLQFLTITAFVVVVGHTAAILNSNRLKS
ncbi:MAG: CDP-alcohol phosphatidyltransferase family protein [Candidatus Nanopelagicales bacterium]